MIAEEEMRVETIGIIGTIIIEGIEIIEIIEIVEIVEIIEIVLDKREMNTIVIQTINTIIKKEIIKIKVHKAKIQRPTIKTDKTKIYLIDCNYDLLILI